VCEKGKGRAIEYLMSSSTFHEECELVEVPFAGGRRRQKNVIITE
jgi:hypothetical protein